MLTFSKAKEEKVVKPPQKPVANNNLNSGERMLPLLPNPKMMPIIKQPKILTPKVPKGIEAG